MSRSAQPSLRREIVLILLVKVALIFAIWFFFFAHPNHPGADGTASALLDRTTMERTAPHE